MEKARKLKLENLQETSKSHATIVVTTKNSLKEDDSSVLSDYELTSGTKHQHPLNPLIGSNESIRAVEIEASATPRRRMPPVVKNQQKSSSIESTNYEPSQQQVLQPQPNKSENARDEKTHMSSSEDELDKMFANHLDSQSQELAMSRRKMSEEPMKAVSIIHYFR